MYQIEVKRYLVEHCFNPNDGWEVRVDIDAMEKGKGKQNPEAKRVAAASVLNWFDERGIINAAHEKYGRVDVIAEHPEHGRRLIEVEGNSSKQKEQAMYSALGQSLLLMSEDTKDDCYGIAVPDEPQWHAQVTKIPSHIRKTLRLEVYLVSPQGVKTLD